jgi:hypothetical protein
LRINPVKRRSIKSKSALSNVISTVILSTTLLTTMLVVTGLTNDILRNQMASTEFDSAKNLMKSIDSEINSLIFKPGASAVIKTSFAYTTPGYTKTGTKMNVTFSGGQSIPKTSIDINNLNLETIQGVGGAFDYTLQGNNSLIVPGYIGSFGRIYISKPYNWRVSLDYNRVQYTYSGIEYLFDGTTTKQYNVIEFVVLEMNFTQFDISDNSMIILKNESIETHAYTFNNNWAMTVTTPNASSQFTLASIKVQNNLPTKVEFSIVHLTATVMEAT